MSDALTARPSGKEFVVNEAGNVCLGTTTPATTPSLTVGAFYHNGDGTVRVVF